VHQLSCKHASAHHEGGAIGAELGPFLQQQLLLFALDAYIDHKALSKVEGQLRHLRKQGYNSKSGYVLQGLDREAQYAQALLRRALVEHGRRDTTRASAQTPV
jgi:hypothetical protein